MGGWAKIPACFVALAIATTPAAHAFDSKAASGPGDAQHLTVEEAAAFSKQIERELASKGARVAMVFRSGRSRDRLPENVRYTHGAFWVYQDIKRQDGSVMKGYAVYNLYHGDGESLEKTSSYLEQDFPFDFASGSSVDDVAVIIPTAELQARILNVMASESYEALHVPAYSLVSNVGDPEFQNCNEFMLDVMAAGIWETDNYAQLKANLAAHFDGTEIEAGLLARMFAPMADPRIRTEDHAGAIRTATYESLASFLLENDRLQETFILMRDELPSSNS